MKYIYITNWYKSIIIIILSLSSSFKCYTVLQKKLIFESIPLRSSKCKPNAAKLYKGNCLVPWQPENLKECVGNHNVMFICNLMLTNCEDSTDDRFLLYIIRASQRTSQANCDTTVDLFFTQYTLWFYMFSLFCYIFNIVIL